MATDEQLEDLTFSNNSMVYSEIYLRENNSKFVLEVGSYLYILF